MSPAVAVLSTGSELLRGRGLDTNLGTFARALEGLGLEVSFHATCGDDFGRIVDELKLAASRADLVLVSGGLGPTDDDHTRPAVEEAFHRPLVLRPALLKAIRARFRRIGVAMSANNRRQAFLPEGATALPNPHGTAPGFELVADGVRLFALPGPPGELVPMLRDHVLPRLRRAYGSARRFELWDARVYGLPEGTVDERVARAVKGLRGITYGTQVGGGLVTVRVRAEGRSLAPARRALARVLGSHLLAGGSLEEDVAALLVRRRCSLAVAESCTGGLVAHRLTNIPGVSAVLREAVVAYANEAKIARLGVPAELLRRHGAVSAEVAAAMAEGVARTSGARLGLATTGIAGPGGGTASKPVGLVFHAVAYRGRTRVERREFPGGRTQVKERAANLALDLARRALEA